MAKTKRELANSPSGFNLDSSPATGYTVNLLLQCVSGNVAKVVYLNRQRETDGVEGMQIASEELVFQVTFLHHSHVSSIAALLCLIPSIFNTF